MTYTYSPGSQEAEDNGCTCPAVDNHYGLGFDIDKNNQPLFIINQGCPLHDYQMLMELTEDKLLMLKWNIIEHDKESGEKTYEKIIYMFNGAEAFKINITIFQQDTMVYLSGKRLWNVTNIQALNSLVYLLGTL